MPRLPEKMFRIPKPIIVLVFCIGYITALPAAGLSQQPQIIDWQELYSTRTDTAQPYADWLDREVLGIENLESSPFPVHIRYRSGGFLADLTSTDGMRYSGKVIMFAKVAGPEFKDPDDMLIVLNHPLPDSNATSVAKLILRQLPGYVADNTPTDDITLVLHGSTDTFEIKQDDVVSRRTFLGIDNLKARVPGMALLRSLKRDMQKQFGYRKLFRAFTKDLPPGSNFTLDGYTSHSIGIPMNRYAKPLRHIINFIHEEWYVKEDEVTDQFFELPATAIPGTCEGEYIVQYDELASPQKTFTMSEDVYLSDNYEHLVASTRLRNLVELQRQETEACRRQITQALKKIYIRPFSQPIPFALIVVVYDSGKLDYENIGVW